MTQQVRGGLFERVNFSTIPRKLTGKWQTTQSACEQWQGETGGFENSASNWQIQENVRGIAMAGS